MSNIIFGMIKDVAGNLLGGTYVKIALVLMLIAGVVSYGEWRYNHGYAKAENIYLKEKNDALETQRIAHAAVVADFNARLTVADTQKRAAESAAHRADAEALKQRKLANNFERKYQEALNDIPLSTTDANDPFTVGFVGMFNVAVRGHDPQDSDSTRAINLSDIARAAGVTLGAPGVALSASAKISVKDVLDVVRHNAGVANTCVSDREILKQWVEDVCDLGYCTGIAPKIEPLPKATYKATQLNKIATADYTFTEVPL